MGFSVLDIGFRGWGLGADALRFTCQVWRVRVYALGYSVVGGKSCIVSEFRFVDIGVLGFRFCVWIGLSV